MYSYVFAFFMNKNNQLLIFEENQRDLQVAVEELSDCLGRRMRTEPLPEIKIKVRLAVFVDENCALG